MTGRAMVTVGLALLLAVGIVIPLQAAQDDQTRSGRIAVVVRVSAPPIVDEALERFPGLKTIWMQIGVSNPDAAERARARGVDVVMNRCPKIEYQRLFGELRMGGFNTGVISSKL